MSRGRRRRGRSLTGSTPPGARRAPQLFSPVAGLVGVGKLTPAQVAEWLAESCAAQGVPVRVTDPQVLAQVAALLPPAGGAPRTRAKRG